ncbi:transglutaminase family protein [Magnetovibrio sp. PR-2]|uniref:transglutaminase family protein n=1 Tax=Magnetovibrio sp. PR-2 TaxID=3120356 RepID=UPI002FCE07A9
MHITINHETVYTYEEPVSYSIQSLRLTPQPYDGQIVRSWSIEAPKAGMLHAFSDSFGNVTHTLVIDKPHEEVRIRVKGEVHTQDTKGFVKGTTDPFPASFYLRETDQTKPDGAIRAIARAAQSNGEGVLDILHALMGTIRDAIDYQTGETHAMTTAIEALTNGAGVCQDHAHVFIAAARAIDIPARYVSGYLLHSADGEESEASHAWAEALVPDLGWVAFDVANSVCTTDHYVRVGVGLDYQEASPVRGVRRGGGDEKLDVSVLVSQTPGSTVNSTGGAQQ